MLKLDEAAVNEQFGRRLDIMSSNAVSRSADFPTIGFLALLRLPGLKLMRLLGHEGAELGMKIIFADKLVKQGGDVVQLVVQQLIEAVVGAIVQQYISISYPLTVGPLMFEYDETVFGTEVTVVTLVEWDWLR